MERVRTVGMLRHEHDVSEISDSVPDARLIEEDYNCTIIVLAVTEVPVGRRRLCAQGGRGHTGQTACSADIVDPDEVVEMTGRVLTDEKLKKIQTPSGNIHETTVRQHKSALQNN